MFRCWWWDCVLESVCLKISIWFTSVFPLWTKSAASACFLPLPQSPFWQFFEYCFGLCWHVASWCWILIFFSPWYISYQVSNAVFWFTCSILTHSLISTVSLLLKKREKSDAGNTEGILYMEWQICRHLSFWILGRKRMPMLHQYIPRHGFYQTAVLAEFQSSFLLLIRKLPATVICLLYCCSWMFSLKCCKYSVPLMSKV